MKTFAFRRLLMTFLAFALLPAVCMAQVELPCLDRIGEDDEMLGEDGEIPLAKVFRAMETRFGIQIRVAPQLATDRLYDPELELVVPLPEDATLEEALEHAIIRNGLLYEKKADHYWVTGGKTPGVHLVEKRYPVPDGDADVLIHAVGILVQHDSWEDWGAGSGVYEYLPAEKTLIIWQTPEVLAEVDDFFVKLTGQYVTPPGQVKLEQALRTELTLQFFEVPLCDVAAILEKRLGVPVRVDEEQIEEELELMVDEPLDSDARDITLASALRNMLDPKGLSYTLDGDTLLITTVEKAREKLDLRFYPWKFSLCDDQVLVVDNAEVLGKPKNRHSRNRGGIRGLGAHDLEMLFGSGGFGKVEVKPSVPVTEIYRGPVEFEPCVDVDSFLDALTSGCAKDDWEETGYGDCRVQILRGPGQAADERFVAVLASQRVHEEVKRFIEALDGKTPWETPAMVRAMAAMEKPVTIQAGPDGITLEEFARRWETQTGAKLYIDENSLKKEAVGLTDMVHLNLVNVRADFALGALRQGFGPAVLNESVWLTRSVNPAGLYPKAYPVELYKGDRLSSVVDIIVTSVDKDSWEELGNGKASITSIPELNAAGNDMIGILVSQTYANHREIDRLLRTYHGRPVPPTDSETRVRDALATKVTLEYTDKSLMEIAADLQTKLGVTIYVDEESWETRIDPELEVNHISFGVKDISLENALELLCRQRSDLRMMVKDEVIHLTTQDRYRETPVMKMYPWKFHVEEDDGRYPFYRHRRYSRYDDLERLFGAGGTGGIMGFLLTDTTPKAEPEDSFPPIDDIGSMLDFITMSIAPDSWEETGTGSATIGPLSQWIVIAQTEDAHREIQRLLGLLERKPIQRTAMEMRIAKRMTEPVTWNFQARTLTEVAWALTNLLEVNFVVDAAEIGDYELETGEEISPNSKVTLQVENMPLAEALAKMLAPLGLGFTVKHDAVLLTAASEAGGQRQHRIYSINGAPDLGLTSDNVTEMVARRLMLTEKEMETSVFLWPCGYAFWSSPYQLDWLFEKYVESGGWLIVNQTPEVHEILGEYLKPLAGSSPRSIRRTDFYDKQNQWERPFNLHRSRSRHNKSYGIGYM